MDKSNPGAADKGQRRQFYDLRSGTSQGAVSPLDTQKLTTATGIVYNMNMMMNTSS